MSTRVVVDVLVGVILGFCAGVVLMDLHRPAPASILEDMVEWWCNNCESRLKVKTQIYARGWLEPADD